MEVFQITPKPGLRVLVVGRSGDQFDFCALLAEKKIDFGFTSYIVVAADYYASQEGFDVFDDIGDGKPDGLADLRKLFSYSDSWEFNDRRIDHAVIGEKYDVIIDTCSDTEDDRLTGLRALAEHNPDAVVLATQYSCTATELVSIIGVSASIIGYTMMFSQNQPQIIDIAPALTTPPQALAKARAFFELCGLATEVVEDRVGLVQMRTLAMLINEAAFALMEGVAGAEEIDKAMQLGVNYPKGLLAWADEIGLDIVLLTLDSLNREYAQERYRPCVLLKQYVRAGWTGKKAGRGFYTYS